MPTMVDTCQDHLASTVLEHLADGVLLVRDDEVLVANRAASRLTGVPTDGLVGHPLPAWVAEGSGRSVSVSVTPCRLDDGTDAQLILLRDTSVQAAREAELVRLADRDGLTGLLNQRSFTRRLHDERERLAPAGRPLGLITMDLDHFKSVNDQHGHPVGDRVLAEAADRLTTAARAIDTVARVGGEEFAWLLPDAAEPELLLAAERLRGLLAGSPFAGDLDLTASIGFCSLQPDEEPDELVRRADEALYWAKSCGRNAALGWTADIADRMERARWAHEDPAHALDALARLADEMDPAPDRGHGRRVASLAVALAAHLDWTPDQQARLHQAGRVHDVGKAAVGDELLGRRGPLTPLETEHVRRHAEIGAHLAAPALRGDQLDWIRHHHTRWEDHPDLPVGAWLLAIADTWDAMSADRCYRPALSPDEALAEIDRCSGTQLHPEAGCLLREALNWWTAA